MDKIADFLDRNGMAVGSVAIDDWTGRTGLAVRLKDGGDQVSPVLADPQAVAAWVGRNRRALRGAARRGMLPPREETLERYRGTLAKVASKVEARRREAEEMLGLMEVGVARASEGMLPEGRELRSRSLEIHRENLASATGHLEGIRALRERVEADPSSLFLPIGALVRVRENWENRPYGLAGVTGPAPVAGTLGIVVAASVESEWAVKVAFYGRMRDRAGEVWNRDIADPLHISFDADSLELVQLGTFVDGRPCRTVDFVGTHVRDGEDMEMVVLGARKAWRIQRFGEAGGAWSEAQGWDDLDELLEGSAPVGGEPREAAAPRMG